MSQGKILASEVGLTNVKFDTALNLTRTHLLASQVNSNDLKNLDIQRILLSYSDLLNKRLKCGVEIIGEVISSIFLSQGEVHLKELAWKINNANQFLLMQEEHLMRNAPDSIQERISNLIDRNTNQLLSIDKSVSQFHDAMKEFNFAMNKLRRISRRSITAIKCNYKKYEEDLHHDFHFLGLIVYFGRHHHLFVINDLTYLVSNDQFLMIHNKVFEIFNVLFSSHKLSGTTFPSTFYPSVLGILKFMTDHLITNKNKSYSLFKNFDGIVSGKILCNERLFDNSQQYFNVLQELVNDKLITRYQLKRLLSLFIGPPHVLIELSALSKLLGHPDIESLFGIDKLRKRTFKENPVSHAEVSSLLSAMKFNFCKEYYTKHSRWPVVTFTKTCPVRLRQAILTNLWIDNPELPSDTPLVNIDDFIHVTLDKCIEFEKCESQFPFLKDTALAQFRSEIENPSLYRYNAKNRRTLLYFLLSTDPAREVSRYLNTIANNDKSCLEYLVIKLTQKERELKLEGRFFGQSPYVERARRCILEENVKNLMKHYNSDQGMTLNELEKFKKMYTFSRLEVDNKDHYVVNFSVDVEAWNNNFRRPFCEPVGREFFDKIFGVQQYVNVMKCFEASKYLVSDGLFDYSWEGQYGGIEGLAQKFWTWIYDTVANRVAFITGFPFFILVNGDDLRVILMIPKDQVPPDELKTYLDQLGSQFESEYKKYGFHLKLQETYSSSELLGFGKIYIYDSAFCSNLLKKVAKIHGFANLIGDLPLEYLKGCMSEVLSTMSYGPNHRSIYFIGVIIFLTYLIDFDQRYLTLSDYEIMLCLMWPSNFGGLPILPYLRCLYKGDSDLETVWISLFLFIYRHNHDLGYDILRCNLSYITKERNFSQLAVNPYNIPNATPSEGSPLITNFIRRRLPHVVINKDFKQLLTRASDEKKKRFVQSLFNCNPCPAKILSILYETSASGLLDEFTQKFEGSKSIGGLLTHNFKSISSIKILKNARKADLFKVRWIFDQIREKNKLKLHPLLANIGNDNLCHKYPCPTAFTSELRDWCWNRQIVGVTYPCIADQIYFLSISSLSHTDFPSAMRITRVMSDGSRDINFEHGPYKLYLGSHTHLKLLSPHLEITSNSPGMQKAIKLLKLYGMLKHLGPECVSVCERSLEEITGIPGQEIGKLAYETTSGSLTHRAPSMHWSPLVGPNELSSRNTYLSFSTRSDPSLKVRAGDWTINFGLIRSHVSLICCYDAEFDGRMPVQKNETYFAKITDCDTCTYEVTDRQIEWHTTVQSGNYGLTGNRYVSITHEERQNILRVIGLVDKQVEKFTRVDISDNSVNSVLLAQKLVANLLVGNELDSKRDQLLTTGFSVNLDDEDLSTLYMQSSVQLASLTDLRMCPPELILSEIKSSLLSWIIRNYPQGITDVGFDSLENLHVSKLPLKSFCESCLESGYWPLLKRFLDQYSQLAPPSELTATALNLQYFLTRLILSDLRQDFDRKKMNPFDKIWSLPLSQLPCPDDMMRALNKSFQVIVTGLLVRWIQSSSGYHIYQELNQNNVSKIINELILLTYIGISSFSRTTDDYTGSYPIFRDLTKQSNIVFIKVLTICGIKNEIIQSLYQELYDCEKPEITPVSIQDILDAKVNVLILNLNDTIKIVRERGKAEYAQFYDSVIKHAPKPSTSKALSLMQKPFNKQAIDAIINIQNNIDQSSSAEVLSSWPIKSIETNILLTEPSDFKVDSSLLWSVIGGRLGKQCYFYHILLNYIPVTLGGDNPIIIFGDRLGSIVGALIRIESNNPIIHVVNVLETVAGHLIGDDITTGSVSSITQIDRMFYVQPMDGDASDEGYSFIRNRIIGYYKQKSPLVIIHWDKHFNHKVGQENMITKLIQLLDDVLIPGGSLILFCKLEKGHGIIRILYNIFQRFNYSTFIRSGISSQSTNAITIILKVFTPNRTGTLRIDSYVMARLMELSKLIKDQHQNVTQNLYNNWSGDHEELFTSYLAVLGQIDLTRLSGSLLGMSRSIDMIQITSLESFLSASLEIIHSLVSTYSKQVRLTQRGGSLSISAQHYCRLLIECILLSMIMQRVFSCQNYSQLSTTLSSFNSGNDLNEVLNKLVDDLSSSLEHIKTLCGESWILSTYRKFYLHIVRFTLYYYIRCKSREDVFVFK